MLAAKIQESLNKYEAHVGKINISVKGIKDILLENIDVNTSEDGKFVSKICFIFSHV